MPRLFTGLEVPPGMPRPFPSFAAALSAQADRRTDYHVTLRFMGDIDDRRPGRLSPCQVRRKPLTLKVEGLESLAATSRGPGRADRAHPGSGRASGEQERLVRRVGLRPTSASSRPSHPGAPAGHLARHVADFMSRRALPSRTFTAGRFVLFSARAVHRWRSPMRDKSRCHLDAGSLLIAMFGWTTTVEPLLAQTPPASDPAQQAPGAAGRRQPTKPPTCIRSTRP